MEQRQILSIGYGNDWCDVEGATSKQAADAWAYALAAVGELAAPALARLCLAEIVAASREEHDRKAAQRKARAGDFMRHPRADVEAARDGRGRLTRPQLAEEVLWLADENARLLATFEEDRAVCICGCPAEEHEDYGEDGESCGNGMHECIRVAPAVLEIVRALRLNLPHDRCICLLAPCESPEHARYAYLMDGTKIAIRRDGNVVGKVWLEVVPWPTVTPQEVKP